MTTCIHCGNPVETQTAYGGGGTYWTHTDGWRDCPPRYASPKFEETPA